MRLVSFLATALLAGRALAQSGAANVVTEVAVREEGGAVVVSIQGTKPPSFTTFSMMDPPRFVVDISDTSFRNVPAETSGAGVVQAVKCLAFGAGASAVGRVTVVFAREVEPPDVQVVGERLLVRSPRALAGARSDGRRRGPRLHHARRGGRSASKAMPGVNGGTPR